MLVYTTQNSDVQEIRSLSEPSCVIVSRSKLSFRCQKKTKNGANIHSSCDLIPQKNHDPNIYFYTEIPDGQTVIYLL